MKQKIEEKTPLKVLYLEDSPQDIEIIRELLLEAGFGLDMECAETKKKFVSLLHENTYDIILSDFKLPGFDAFGALKLHNEICPDIPFICVSGSIGEEIAIELIMKGAVDYVLKDQMIRLPSAIKRVLNEVKEKNLLAQVEEELLENQKRFSTIFNASPIGTAIARISDGKIIEANPAITAILGYQHDEMIGRTTAELNAWVDLGQRDKMVKILHDKGFVRGFETIGRRKSGEIINLLVSAEIIDLSGVKYMLSLFDDITERKRMEAALIENEVRYRTLVTQSPDGIFIVDNSGAFISVNKAMCDKFKFSEKEFLSMKIWDIVPRQYLSLHKNGLKAVLKGESEKSAAECEVKGKDGIRHIVEVLSTPYYKGKELIGFQGIARDITERKLAEEALRESELQFRELWRSTVEGIAILDNGIIIEVNDAMCQMLGYTREQALGKSLLEFAPAEVHDQIRERITEKREGRFEIPALRADGTKIQPETVANQIIYKRKQARMITVRDITEQKQAESKLRENEQFFRLLFTTSPDSILIFDPFSTAVPWEILDCNEVACKMNGYTREELIGKSIDMLNAEVLEPEEREAHIKRLQQKGVLYFETFHRHRDGHVFPIDVASSIVTLGGRQLILGIDRDITARKQSEEALRQVQKLEGLGTLAGGIAHDFNNILGIILAYNTGIKRFINDPKKMELATDTITKAVDRGKTLVQQILTFARKTETAFGAVNVNEVIMEIMTMILETFPKTLTYSQNFEKGLPYINADRIQLYQALLNLCVNARDAMPNGGMLAIKTRMLPGVDLSAKHPDVIDNNYICIEVSDTGEGMNKEVKNRIFEPFFTTKGIGKGTGLGLAVVFGVIQTHKGFVDVESEIGKGTTFKLYLPALKPEESISEKEAEETLEEIPGGTETLLIVEDEEMLIMSLQMVLLEKGYNVLPAKDGLEALKIYQENKNDIALVLTDLGLPIITGLEVCQRIKNIKSNERMILATGYLDPEMKSEFLKAGIQNFLYKPYEMINVLKTIRGVLDGK